MKMGDWFKLDGQVYDKDRAGPMYLGALSEIFELGLIFLIFKY